MERTRFSKPKSNTQHLEILGSVVARMLTAANLGYQYGTDRDVYKALGYETGDIKFDKYLARYLRQDIAKAIIDRPVRATWQGSLELIESSEEEETPFEKTWRELVQTLGLKSIFARVDRLTGIGQYGVLLLGMSDVRDIEGFAQPIVVGAKLAYVKPFGEQSAKIDKFVEDPKDKRYGMPLVYSIQVADVGGKGNRTIQVHYSRVLHVTDDNLESEIYGTPRLQAVFNRLMDLDKVVGGDAEMFWRGARPGYQGKVDPNYQMTTTTKEDLKDQIDEYENGLRRILINEGIDLQALAPQIADPSSHYNTIMKCISAETGIPLRVLEGSERGELASTQDASAWREYVQARRDEFAEPCIVRPVVNRFIELGILPKPSDLYTVRWSDLYALSEKERVEIGKARATALREYTYSPMEQALIPPRVFNELFLGFTTDQVELVDEMSSKMISEEELFDKAMEQLDKPEKDGIDGSDTKTKPTASESKSD